MNYITKETTIAEIVYNYPELIEVLHKNGLYCFAGGGRPAWGTLALQARFRGIEQIDELVEKLNVIVQQHRANNTDLTANAGP